MSNRERCKAPPPTIQAGPWAGSAGMHDYCAHCSKNLCDRCLAEGKCQENPIGKHESENAD